MIQIIQNDWKIGKRKFFKEVYFSVRTFSKKPQIQAFCTSLVNFCYSWNKKDPIVNMETHWKYELGWI